MSMQLAVQLAKMKRHIAVSGVNYVFTRQKIDPVLKEPTEETETVNVRGIFHETSAGYLTILTSQAAKVEASKSPMILCLWSDAQALQKDDSVTVNGKVRKVTAIKNIGELNVAADVMLDEVQ